MEGMESKRNKSRMQTIVIAVVLLLAAAGMLTATFVIAASGAPEIEGQMDGDSIGLYPLYYSTDTANDFRHALKQVVYNLTGQTLDPDYLGARVFLEAFRGARISAAKVHALSDYIRSAEISEEVFEKFTNELPLLVVDGEVQYTEAGNPMRDTSNQADVYRAVFAALDVMSVFNDFLQQTGITSRELGAVLYEIELMAAGEERKAVLALLGQARYITLIVDTAAVFAEFSSMSDGYGLTLKDGRVAREILYEQGSRLLDILDEFGAENLEILFGINKKLVTDEQYENASAENKIVYDAAGGVMESLEGKTGALLHLVGTVMTEIPAAAVDSYINFLNDGSAREEAYTRLSLARVLYAALQKSADAYGFTVLELTETMAEISAQFLVIDGVYLPKDYETALSEERAALHHSLAGMLHFVASGQFASIRTAADVAALSEGDFLAFSAALGEVTGGYERLLDGAETFGYVFLMGWTNGLSNSFVAEE